MLECNAQSCMTQVANATLRVGAAGPTFLQLPATFAGLTSIKVVRTSANRYLCTSASGMVPAVFPLPRYVKYADDAECHQPFAT